MSFLQNEFFDKGNAQRSYFDGGPGCFGDSGGPLWREVFDKKTNRKVPVLVGVFSFLLWGTCHGSQNPKYYGRVSSVVNWIKKYVPEEQICEYSNELSNHREIIDIIFWFHELKLLVFNYSKVKSILQNICIRFSKST